jgi:hypothetical protein
VSESESSGSLQTKNQKKVLTKKILRFLWNSVERINELLHKKKSGILKIVNLLNYRPLEILPLSVYRPTSSDVLTVIIIFLENYHWYRQQLFFTHGQIMNLQS